MSGANTVRRLAVPALAAAGARGVRAGQLTFDEPAPGRADGRVPPRPVH